MRQDNGFHRGEVNLHIAITLFTIFAAWRRSDWENWRNYQSTMLFVIMGVLLYLFFYKNALLWDLQKHLLNHTLTELVYAFIVLPLTVLIFLSGFPVSFKGQAYKILKYIVIYSMIEFIFTKLGFISYKNGWNIWLSIGWNCMMFPMVVLHYKKPLYAYVTSFIGLIIFLYLFPVKM